MTNPIVIAHVLSSFGLGGQESVAVELARKQRSEGHTVLAVSLAPLREGPSARVFRDAGISTKTIAKGPRVDVSLPLRLGAYLRREHATVVHTHNPHALIYGAPAARLAGAGAIHSKHGMNPDRARRLWLRRTAARLVDTYVAVSPALRAAALANEDCDSKRLRVVSNGIDVTRFAPNSRVRCSVRRELGIHDDAWVVCTVGRLAPEKDQAMLVDAMIPLLDERRRLLIVGDGPERDALREQIARTGKGAYVYMTGARSDVERILAACDVFALTSRTEGLPLVLLEAMATALPVISTAVGGIPDLVQHRVTGFLVPAKGGLGPLTRQLEWLSMDESLSHQIGRAARHHIVKEYSVERMASEYAALYTNALASRHNAARQTAALSDH